MTKFHYSPISQAVALALLTSMSVVQPAMSADIIINESVVYTPELFLPADNLFIGNTRAGTLLINNGNQATTQNITIGNGVSDGTLTLSGVGSSLTSIIKGAVDANDVNPTAEWKNSAITLIGGRSNGTVNVTDGASFVFGKLLLDGQGDKLGKILVSGQGSSLAFIIYPDNPDLHSPANPMLFIGNSGNGELSLENGARVTFPDKAAPVIVGALQGSRGTINVSSNAVADLSPGVFQVFGDQGTANVNITSGGLLHVGGFGSVWGNADTGRATLTVSGAESSFTTNGKAIFGGRGQAIININEGLVNLTPRTAITFADSGTATVNIDRGGRLTIGGYGSVWGNQSTANSTLTVSGAGSVFNSTNGATTIGNAGTSLVNINAGGAWTSSGAITIGNSGTGTVNINAGGGWTSGGPITIGKNGAGTVNINAGASWVISGGGGLVFGDNSNGRGQATISGASASLSNTGTGGTFIGNAGTGSLTVSNGATANLGGWGAKLGGAATGNGTMAVSGAGSSLQIGGGVITIGDAGTGTVNVNAGGMWGSTGRRLILGNQKDSNGIVMVSGASSSFSFTGSNRRDIGNAGAGSLSIDTGGAINLGGWEVSLGTAATGNGSVIVSGAGSTLTHAATFNVGNAGTGLVNVKNGGRFTSGSLTLASQAGSSGSLVVGGLEGDAAAGSGVLALSGSTLRVGAGAGKLIFNHTDNNYQFSNNISITNGGSLDVRVLNGTTTLNTAAWVGDTTLRGGQLNLGAPAALGGKTLTFDGGTLNLRTGSAVSAVQNLVIKSGSLMADLAGVTGPAPNTRQLFAAGDTYVRNLITATSLNGLVGNLRLVNNNASSNPGSVTEVLNDPTTSEAIGTGTWSVKLGTQGTNLGLAYGLQSISLNDGKTLTLNRADSGNQSATFNAALTGAGNVELNATGGEITFGNAANAYTGRTSLTGGTLNLTNNALGNTSGLSAAAGTTVNLLGNTVTLRSLNTAANSQVNLGGGALTLNSFTSVADSQVNLGGGTLTLNASQVNGTLSGAGSLNLASGNTTLGGNNANLSAAVVIEQPAIVTLMQSNGLGSGSLQLKGGLVLAGNTPSTLNNVISGAGTLTGNSGTWTLNQNNTFTGGTTLGANGNLILLASGAAGTGGIVNGGTLTLGGDADTSFTLANTLAGGGALVKNGEGTWTIDRDNTFTGSTTVSGGSLIVTRTGALGTGAIINNGTLTLNGVRGAADAPLAVFANTLTGSGSLIVNNNSNVRINALSGFGGRFTVDQGSQLSTELAAIDSHLSDSVVNGTLNVTTRAESGLLLNRLITGQGTVNLSVNNANATYGLAGFDGFTGTVNLTNGKYLLDNTTLNKAQLVSNQGNVITLGEHITTTGALNINGGTLDLGKQPPVTATSLAMNSGTLKADLGNIVPGKGNVNNLFNNGSIYIRTLLHAQNGLTGSYGNLTLADSHGAGTTPFVDLLKDADGNTLGTARWGVILGQQGNNLNLNWGLQNISLTPGKSLSLNLADSGSTQSTFDATLEGDGGVNINAAGGAITFNGANTYTGATSLTAGTLNLKANNALGGTAGLSTAAGTTVNLLENSTQTLNKLDSKASSQLNLGGGSLTLKGGLIEGALSGNVSGKLTFAEGKSTLGNNNTGLNAKIDIQKAATVTLKQANGLGAGNIKLNGVLALVNVKGNLTNALEGAGTLSIDPTDVTLSGDNSKFTGLFTIDDAESTLRVANKNNLGQASIRNAGTLAINTNDDWTLSNSVTGTGNVEKSGTGTLTADSNSLQSTGKITVDAGTLVLSQGNGKASSLWVNKDSVLASGADITAPLTLNGTLSALNSLPGHNSDNANLILRGGLNLTNSGVINLVAASGKPGNTLTLSGGNNMGGGTIQLATELGNDASASDKVILNNTHLTGTTKLLIKDAGGDGAQTQQGIEVVKAQNGSTTTVDNFTLARRVAKGAYDYSLSRGGKGGDANSWYLISQKTFRPEVGTYLMNREMTQKLMDIPLSAELRSSNSTGAWLRAGNSAISHNESGDLRVSARARTLNLGVDILNKEISRGYMRAGVILGTGSATTWSHSPDGSSARGTVNGMSGGVYSRWSAEKEALKGPSVQGSLQYGTFSHSVMGNGLGRESYRAKMLQVELRAEHSFTVYESAENKQTLTPMLGLKGDIYHVPDFTEQSTRTQVHDNGRNSLTTEVGMRWQGSIQARKATLRPYLEASWLRDGSKNTLNLDSNTINSLTPRNRLAIDTGLEASLTPALSTFLGVNSEMGASDYRTLGVTGGIKYRF